MKLNLKLQQLKLITALLAFYMALDVTIALLVYRKHPQAVSIFFDSLSLEDKIICLTIYNIWNNIIYFVYNFIK